MARAKQEAGPRGKIQTVPLKHLIAAPWNYKRPATPDMVVKLAASIARDASAGVMAVRELGPNRLEVIDGNHRLEAIGTLGWPQVPVENFGKITKAEAILIAQRRNHQWFEDDLPALSKLFRDDVLKEFTLDDLVTFMPMSREQLERLSSLADFNWEALPDSTPSSDYFTIKLTPELKDLWERWLNAATERIGEGTSKVDAFELGLKVALSAHEKGAD